MLAPNTSSPLAQLLSNCSQSDMTRCWFLIRGVEPQTGVSQILLK
jgi:hypothetical protein